MAEPRRRAVLDGREFIWNGKQWSDAKTGEIPPVSLVVKLNAQISRDLEEDDGRVTDFGEILDRARAAREVKQWGRSERLARTALEVRPGDPGALASLCASLRSQGRPEAALRESQHPSRTPSQALLTTRAAAMCDLEMWTEAKREVGRALAIGPSGEAYNVVKRIKAARPELYEEQ